MSLYPYKYMAMDWYLLRGIIRGGRGKYLKFY